MTNEAKALFEDVDIKLAIANLLKIGKAIGLSEKEVKDRIKRYLEK